jgi:hypothetical protein
MDRQPEKALQAIWGSRTTLLPNAINSERRALEARALMDLGRYDHALEVLDRDQSAPAREVRGDILWKQQKWAEAAPLYEARLGDRYKQAEAPLTPSEESWLIRAGVGYSLSGNPAALDRLRGQYSPFIPRARSANAIRVALDDNLAGLAGVNDFARPVGQRRHLRRLGQRRQTGLPKGKRAGIAQRPPPVESVDRSPRGPEKP